MPPDEYALLFAHMLDGFALHEIILDSSGKPVDYRFLAINPAFEKQTGLRAADLIGRTVLDALPDTEPRWIATYGKVALTGEPVELEEYAQGLDRYFRVVAFRPRPMQFAVTFQDVTEITRAAELLELRVKERTAELQSANEELASFSYAISHDLCSPLRAINGFATILKEKCAQTATADPQAKVFLQRICKATLHMEALIRGLLTLSKTTQAAIRCVEVDVTDMAKRIVETLHSEDTSRKAAVTIHPGMTAMGDSSLIRVLLTNLINNAWKFTSERKTTEIRIGYSDAVFFVEDNGAGFDDTEMDGLFKPFHRLHGITEFPGTGIGLATVQRIVHRHGGEVWARAQVDKGATFYFTLPRVPPK